MRERGIIFNAEMVRAVLSGSKTQTRRIVKASAAYILNLQEQYPHKHYTINCPFGAVGDRLWVRETWQVIHQYTDENGEVDETRYARSIPKQRGNYWHPVYAEAWDNESRESRDFPWRPSLHMPRWASRITLEITGVRVERLRDISEEDAATEGIPPAGDLLPDYPGTYLTPKGDFATAKVAFQRLWESIYGEESWQANPWVWVIEFKRVEVNRA
ncbi:hypothetical protein PUG81_05185 [Erwiniaceae bacterium L1_54_6]|nr:hypothetical protein [Erwiniaceae bacterium L1_54_6]